MVRTKTRARTLEERYPKDKYPNGPPNDEFPPKTGFISNNVIFDDHTGNPALMSWRNSGAKHSLPHLASWVFYMVHPDVLRDFDGCAFQRDLEDTQSLCRGEPFRYEFFFLPGATAEECHAHYCKEMEARGAIWRQIRKVKRAINLKKQENAKVAEDDLVQEPASDQDSTSDQESASDQDATANNQLPGLVWPKHDSDCYYVSYRGWLFMYPDADINCGGAASEARNIYLVTFDPIPQDWTEDEVIKFDPMEYPVYAKRMKARVTEVWEHGIVGWMEMRKVSHWHEEANHATCEALELGWESW
ncbi:hypothetical protein EDB81DRAFT_844854 [Dactylonectria macrodidyma]|uniref:Uncharacterized protein n=1 Tax=Dactylonectria macrodidyma TaxID=307937 RepID=A0A9P9EBV0_9HYPO|nr:hypothetical protein EDB81DRAFT_844854 [Dactylonectria macrodidyma]